MFRNRLASVSEGKPMSKIEPDTQTEKQTSNSNARRKSSVFSNYTNKSGKNDNVAMRKKSSTAGLTQGSTASSVATTLPRLSLSSTNGPSLMGLLASKRLAKQLTSRIRRKRYGSFCDSSKASEAPKKEPTYRMEPARKFDTMKVEECIKSVLDERLQKFPYNPKFCANMSKILSDEIKGEVKMLNFDRYKLVCTVLIGQRKDQGTQVASRCAWNEKLDNYASYTFMNDNIFATAVVYGIYMD